MVRVSFPLKDSHLRKKATKSNKILEFSAKRREPLPKAIDALTKIPVAPWVLAALKYREHRGFAFVGYWFFKIAYNYVINHYFVKY